MFLYVGLYILVKYLSKVVLLILFGLIILNIVFLFIFKLIFFKICFLFILKDKLFILIIYY